MVRSTTCTADNHAAVATTTVIVMCYKCYNHVLEAATFCYSKVTKGNSTNFIQEITTDTLTDITPFTQSKTTLTFQKVLFYIATYVVY